MQETQALHLLDIPRSTFKEWSNPTHKKHKLYLLLKRIDAQYAQSCIVQKTPKNLMVILNRNIKQEAQFSDNEIFKLFSKKSYAKLTARERVAFAKIVRECEENDLNELFNEDVVSKEAFLHLLGASPLAPFSAFTFPNNTLSKIVNHQDLLQIHQDEIALMEPKNTPITLLKELDKITRKTMTL